MIAIIPIALVAGVASALMFASMISGALISVLLLYLAPLPLMTAALGWGPLCAAIGGIIAATGFGIIFSSSYCTAFAVGIALPASGWSCPPGGSDIFPCSDDRPRRTSRRPPLRLCWSGTRLAGFCSGSGFLPSSPQLGRCSHWCQTLQP